MGRPIGTLRERQAKAERVGALSTVTMTERLLALILIELRETRRREKTAKRSVALQRIGFSRAAAAALLDSSPASLSVLERRLSEATSHPARILKSDGSPAIGSALGSSLSTTKEERR